MGARGLRHLPPTSRAAVGGAGGKAAVAFPSPPGRDAMPRYVAIVDGKDDVWDCRVPDFDGVHGGGCTPDMAIADAESALRQVVCVMLDDGDQLPLPSRLNEVCAKIQAAGGVAGEAVYLWVWGR